MGYRGLAKNENRLNALFVSANLLWPVAVEVWLPLGKGIIALFPGNSRSFPQIEAGFSLFRTVFDAVPCKNHYSPPSGDFKSALFSVSIIKGVLQNAITARHSHASAHAGVGIRPLFEGKQIAKGRVAK